MQLLPESRAALVDAGQPLFCSACGDAASVAVEHSALQKFRFLESMQADFHQVLVLGCDRIVLTGTARRSRYTPVKATQRSAASRDSS